MRLHFLKKKKKMRHYFIINQFGSQPMKEDVNCVLCNMQTKGTFQSDGKEIKTVIVFFVVFLIGSCTISSRSRCGEGVCF